MPDPQQQLRDWESCEVQRVEHAAYPEWRVNEDHDVEIRTLQRPVGFRWVTLTENDLRAMLAEAKNA